MGDPSLEVEVQKSALARASVKATRRNQLALNLMDIVFDPATLAMSTVNGTRDGVKQYLDPAKVEAMRSK